MTGDATRRSALRRTLTRGLAAIVVGMLAWLVTLSPSSIATVAPVLEQALPITEPSGEVDFSLDARFVQTLDANAVYVLEQRAAPMHRVVRIDPVLATMSTVWSVPAGALVHSLAASPDGSTLALAVTEDYRQPGNELVLVDTATGSSTTVWSAESGDHITDLVWDLDGSAVWATHVLGDQVGADALSVIAIGVSTGIVVDEIAMAVNPAPIPEGLAVLSVDPDTGGRRSVTIIGNGDVADLAPAGSPRNLDHLVYDGRANRLLVSASSGVDGPALSLGAIASAGAGRVDSSEWYEVGLGGRVRSIAPLQLLSTVVYDVAAGPDGSLVFATQEGLSIAGNGGQPVSVVASRAFRKVAA